ncbi:MAG: aminotransferase class IV [Odoribacter sp.]|nr:aminotransferase class IV [Odoribacter sp.]
MILLNNVIQEGNGFSEKIFETGLSIYEVIRVFNGHPIFLKDNLMRLDNSLNKSNIGIRVESLNIPDKLNRLINLEHITEGNLKYVLHFTGDNPDEYIFQIPHAYPRTQDYENGVPVMTCEAVRKQPEVKYINPELRALTDRLIHENQVYEVLLVDTEGYITEGSRSNVFFIKKDTLYTTPTEYVLPGTSRKRVFDICQKYHLPVIEERIACQKLPTFDAVFLTGTSPLLLPINQINDIRYAVHSPFLRQLMSYYFALLDK